MGVARTFLNLQLFSDLTAIDNVWWAAPLVPLASVEVMLGLPGCGARSVRCGSEPRLLQLVGLEQSAFEQARNLAWSGSQARDRRALGLSPALLLPRRAGGGSHRAEIEELNATIKRVRDHGIAILLIEHHMDMLMAVSDDITVLDFGGR